MKTQDWLGIGLVAGIGYGLWYFFKQGPGAAVINAGKAASNAAANIIASPFVSWVFAQPGVVPSGNVILPNGQKVPLAQLNVTFDDANNVASFVYQGYGYIIRPNPNGGPGYDSNGDYHAE